MLAITCQFAWAYQSQSHDCWEHGREMNQGISSNVTDVVILEYPGISFSRVKKDTDEICFNHMCMLHPGYRQVKCWDDGIRIELCHIFLATCNYISFYNTLGFITIFIWYIFLFLYNIFLAWQVSLLSLSLFGHITQHAPIYIYIYVYIIINQSQQNHMHA